MSRCANRCGAEIRRTRPGDGIDPADYEWVHVFPMPDGELANPICDLTPVATPELTPPADLEWWESRANILASALRTAAAAEPAGSPAAQVYQAMLAGMTERYGDPGPLFPAGDHHE